MDPISHDYNVHAPFPIAYYTIPDPREPPQGPTGSGWLIPGGGQLSVPNCDFCADRLTSMRAHQQWGSFAFTVFWFDPEDLLRLTAVTTPAASRPMTAPPHYAKTLPNSNTYRHPSRKWNHLRLAIDRRCTGTRRCYIYTAAGDYLPSHLRYV